MFVDGVRAPGLGFCPCSVAAARFVPMSDGMEPGSELGLGVAHSARGGHITLLHPASCSPGQLHGTLPGISFSLGVTGSELSSCQRCVRMQ